MSFKDDFPNYKDFQDTDIIYSCVPAGVTSALKGLLVRGLESTSDLKSVCYDLATRIPAEPTQNWGWDFLIGDFHDYLDILSGKLPKFLDFLYDFAKGKYSTRNFCEDLNELFEDNKFGYRLITEDGFPHFKKLHWKIVEEPDLSTDQIVSAQEQVKDICSQSYSHLEQAKEQLFRSGDNERARKDCVRDSLSSMEALINKLGEDSDISKSIGNLRSDGRWGPDIIIKEGLSIWNQMHKLFPDIRHGNHIQSDLSQTEAFYWLERIMVYIKYISRKNGEINS